VGNSGMWSGNLREGKEVQKVFGLMHTIHFQFQIPYVTQFGWPK